MLKRISIIVLALVMGVHLVSAQEASTPATCDPYQIGKSDLVINPEDLNAAPTENTVDAGLVSDLDGFNPDVIIALADNVTGIDKNIATFANPNTHLFPSHWATVTTHGNHLKVYQGNCLEAAVLAQLATGARVTVLDGPIASEGFAWWRVRQSDLTGWVIEGQGQDIWLQGVA